MILTMRCLLVIFLFAASIAVIPSSRADTWLAPVRAVLSSADGRTRFTVTPRDLIDDTAFWTDLRSLGPRRAGQRPGGATQARGLLEQQRGNGGWVTVWEGPLVNDVGPANVMVVDGGQHVVTFGDWHAYGVTRNAVTIYGPGGRLVRTMALSDILPRSFVDALPRSASSISWHGSNHFSADNRRLVLAVVAPAKPDGQRSPEQRYIAVEIDLATGTVLPPSDPGWDQAVANADALEARRRVARAAAQAAFIAPLTGPKDGARWHWYDYLREAFARLALKSRSGRPSMVVVEAGETATPDPSLQRLTAALNEVQAGDVLMIASPTAPKKLAILLTERARSLNGKLSGVRVYLALPKVHYRAASAALAPTGAETVLLDPAKGIPQRPERLAESPFAP